jgi:hypothetical protein
MGNGVGVYDEDEVSNLSAPDREELKKQAMQQLNASEAIRDIVRNNPKLLTGLTADPQIKSILKDKLNPLLDRLKGISRGP